MGNIYYRQLVAEISHFPNATVAWKQDQHDLV